MSYRVDLVDLDALLDLAAGAARGPGLLFQVNLEVTVLDYDMLGGSDAIGKVTLGKNRKKLEKKHWVEMVENPRRPIIHWHQLKDPEPGDGDDEDDKKKKDGKKDGKKDEKKDKGKDENKEEEKK